MARLRAGPGRRSPRGAPLLPGAPPAELGLLRRRGSPGLRWVPGRAWCCRGFPGRGVRLKDPLGGRLPLGVCVWVWEFLVQQLQWVLGAVLTPPLARRAGLGQSAMGERNVICSSDGNVEEPLMPQDGGASPNPEVPGATGKRIHRRVVGRCPTLHPVWVVVLAVLVALVLALAVAVAVHSAGRCGGDPAVPAALVLACPEDWVGYRNVCYSFSRAEGSWEWSQEQCSSHGASLAMPRREGEMEFLWSQKAHVDCWLGLRRQGERLQWVDGSSFNQTPLIVIINKLDG
ncbi:C-type lectin domain family 2 member D-like isoform X2 [Chroicocephalus ridibundus]|uniref:C-type lectin domain family 2 member D-like isoform X2 n=1 Tax=Chroicocephalus ridibundus TaxID=1192867 RepID=UPI002FDE7829